MTILEFLFGKRKSPADVLRENRQILNRATRELDRETRRLDRQEAVTIAEIRKNVKAGQMVSFRVYLICAF
jgi:charged multivesicular body protein 2A